MVMEGSGDQEDANTQHAHMHTFTGAYKLSWSDEGERWEGELECLAHRYKHTQTHTHSQAHTSSRGAMKASVGRASSSASHTSFQNRNVLLHAHLHGGTHSLQKEVRHSGAANVQGEVLHNNPE